MTIFLFVRVYEFTPILVSLSSDGCVGYHKISPFTRPSGEGNF